MTYCECVECVVDGGIGLGHLVLGGLLLDRGFQRGQIVLHHFDLLQNHVDVLDVLGIIPV